MHFSWRKRAFCPHWILRGAPGYVGSIEATGDASAAAYVWSISFRSLGVAGNPIASGVAPTLSHARLLALRAVFAALRMAAGRPEPSPAWGRQTVLSR
ncbi:MAG: hypothetical protein LC793_15775 [Thermomicrobia bacterium]|nr:hypothetical protein [Thermomicrobia bacterium]